MIDVILVIIGSLGLLIGTITDFQKREVADWINFGMIFSGIGLRLVYTAITFDWQFLLFGIMWVVATYIFSLFMYYSGQWGGGDCKMIMGLGALFGTTPYFFNQTGDFTRFILPFTTSYNISFMAHFLFNAFFIGSIYGIFWTILLAIIHKKRFIEEYKKNIASKEMRYIIITIVILFIIGYVYLIFNNMLYVYPQVILWIVAITPLFIAFIRSVEKGCMIRPMYVKDLTEGEWIAEEVWIKKPKKRSFLSSLKEEFGKIFKDKTTWQSDECDTLLKILYQFSDGKETKRIHTRKKNIKNNLSVKMSKKLESIFQRFNKIYPLSKKDFETLINLDSDKEFISFVKKHKLNEKKIRDFFKGYLYCFNQKYICGPKDLGIRSSQIEELQTLPKKSKMDALKVKIGIPFVPAFALAFVFTAYFGNIIIFLMKFFLN